MISGYPSTVRSGNNGSSSYPVADLTNVCPAPGKVKTTERGGIRGFDAHKRVKGRKRHILVDTLGCRSHAESSRPTSPTGAQPLICSVAWVHYFPTSAPLSLTLDMKAES